MSTATGGDLRVPARSFAVIGTGLAALALLCVVHVGQGSSGIGLSELAALLTGTAAPGVSDIFMGSRLPRLLAGVVAGGALGVSGLLIQTTTRNQAAAPDTLGVNAGAYLAVVAASFAGLNLGALPQGTLAFAGGLAAALLVLALGGRDAPGRVILAGTAVAMALMATATMLLMLDEYGTRGLFLWGSGSLVQSDVGRAGGLLVVVAAAVLAAMALARPLDLLALGDDIARSLGTAVPRVRAGALLLAIALAAAAVTVAGPLAFVGLIAPVSVRLLGLGRHRALIPAAAVTGMVLLLGADTLARAVFDPADGHAELPAGIVTALLGAPFFVVLARRLASGHVERGAAVALPGRRRVPYPVVLALSFAALATAFVLGLRIGDVPVTFADMLAPGDELVRRVLALRVPRLVVAAVAGAALAAAGVAVQAVIRNPLAEPGLLGVTGGAGVAAVGLLILVPAAPRALLPLVAFAGALAALGLLVAVAYRKGSFDPVRVVLVGIGILAGAQALVYFAALKAGMALAAALTWMSGSTYARSSDDLVWLALPMLAAVLLWLAARPLDLLALGEDLSRSLGLPLNGTRMAVLSAGALLAGGAAAAVGSVGFVGLVAPHLARRLVGPGHRRLLPAAMLLGAALVVAADSLGRWLLAPKELPSGLIVALVGTPYLIWLLRRSR
ncbi:iron ABC transporter permease [Nonomuraea recticatena]|uniref:iron ABC transporter permease n=1 Tax=Nonomuraea recticatena TaxID=46178 RepID=UPI003605BDF6